MGYFNIHTHDEFSNMSAGLDSINKLPDLVKKAQELGLTGLAITNHDNLSEIVSINNMQKKLRKEENDFTLAIGNEIYLLDEFDPTDSSHRRYYHFILCAKDKIGYQALIELSTKAWYRSAVIRKRRRVVTLKSDIEEILSWAKGHLVATTACLGGEFPTKLTNPETEEEAFEFIDWCRTVFGDKDFFIELQPSKIPDQIKFNTAAVQQNRYSNFIIATDAHYQDKEDFPIFEAFLRSQRENREVKEYYEYARLQSEEEVRELLHYLPKEIVDKALENTEIIRRQIEFYDLAQDPRIPKVQLEDISLNISNDFFEMLQKGDYPTLQWAVNEEDIQTRACARRCLNMLQERNIFNKEYLDRLEEEFEVNQFQSEQLHDNFFAYANTMRYYIDMSWSIDCAVGPSRGSASGSLLNYLMDIVQMDPVQYALPFWRYLGKSRVTPLDIDCDFQPSKRPALFAKIREERGELGLVQVATKRTLTLRAAIAAAARGYRSENHPKGLDPDIALYLSSLIEVKRGFVATLKQTLNGDETTGYSVNHTFIKECAQYPGLLEIIQKIEGLIVGSGMHAAAVILFDDQDRLIDHCSLMRAPSGDLCTALDLEDVEKVGRK